MPTYTGSFPLVAQGQAVTVKLDGVSLTDPAPGNVGSAVVRGSLPFSYEYDDGDDDTTLVATVQTSAGLLTAYLTLDVEASIAAGGGGGGTTDGVGAVFFGGGDLDSPLDNTYYFSNFEATDDPPRAPQRDDLMVIDGGDDTTINVVRSGLYDISLNVPVQPSNLVVPGGDGPYRLEAVVQVWVNGNSFPPAYDYNNRAQWDVKESASSLPTIFTNWTFPQELHAGDTVQLAVKSHFTGGVEALTGSVILDPDITFVLTYRGALPA